MAKSIDLTDLGITSEELRQRVVDKIAADIMNDECFEDDLQRKVSKMLKDKVDAAVTELGDRVVGPRVGEMLEDLCLQQTNKWGEATGQKMTFIEYLTDRAEKYMIEPVDHSGKTKAEAGSYSWNKSQARIAHMIDAHLQYSIKTAMDRALADANSAIAEGITATVKMKLAEVVAGIKTTVKTR